MCYMCVLLLLQIVQFILQNTGSPQQALGDGPITGGFCDPYTGGGTGERSAPPPRPTQVPAAAPGPMSVTGGFCDPFTGGASSSRGAGSSSSSSQLPVRVYLLFDSPPPAEGLKKKLLEFNAALQSSPELGPAALITEQEAAPGGEGVCARGGGGVTLPGLWWGRRSVNALRSASKPAPAALLTRAGGSTRR
jgi:phospholipase A-2-activating protein